MKVIRSREFSYSIYMHRDGVNTTDNREEALELADDCDMDEAWAMADALSERAGFRFGVTQGWMA